MYRNCIFCSAALGANDAIEEFPVGRSVAFDAWKGRLWAVCPKCGRWNLAPLEERWEAVERCERLFREARLRVHSENVGLAMLADGTRLVRVGEALPGELASWRYGRELVRRRRAFVIRTAARLLLADVGVFIMLAERSERRNAILYRAPAPESTTGTDLLIRASHLWGARVSSDGTPDGLRAHFPRSAAVVERGRGEYTLERIGPPVTLRGEAARAVLARALVQVNDAGATPGRVRDAAALLERAGTADACIAHLAGARSGDVAFEKGFWRPRVVRAGERLGDQSLSAAQALALEMALHEETERRALEGDLARLEAAWREAEEIAAIADSLPDDPLERWRARRPS